MPGPEIIHLKVGEEHVLRLTGIGTTGYEWQAELAHKKIVSVKKEIVETKPKGNFRAGESSDEQFTIKALQSGKTEMHLTLSRAWEKGNKPAEKKDYIVIVE